MSERTETNKNGTVNITNSEEHHDDDIHGFHSFTLEIMCIAWFTFEYIVRFITSPNKWHFLKSLLNTIDLMAIFPYFIIIIMKGTFDASDSH